MGLIETTEVKPGNVNYGPGDLAYHGEIVRAVVGSKLHGLAVGGQDDTDEMGVYIPGAAHVLGLSEADTFTWRTQPEGVRSGPGDIDRTIYTLRRFLSLATQGNPTILALFFAPDESLVVRTGEGDLLRALAPLVVSRAAGVKFLGYLTQQRIRMDGGGKQNRLPKRPELIAAHGWDVKYGSHALRLGLQGVELLTTGRLALPMAEPDRSTVLAVRRGEVSQKEARRLIDEARARLVELLDGPMSLPVRDRPDRQAVDRYLVEAHQRAWAKGEATDG